MNPLALFRGLPQVSRQEFLANLKSVRLLIMVVVLALAVVGGSYGLSAGTGGSALPSLVVWGHAAYEANGSHLAVGWVSDPFGQPLSNLQVDFWNRPRPPEADTLLGTAPTDANGFARLDVGIATSIEVSATRGSFRDSDGIIFGPNPVNFTVSMHNYDLDDDGLQDEFGFHIVTRAGDPAAANLSVNGTFVRAVDARGFGRLDLPLGLSNVTVEVAGEELPTTLVVREDPFGFLSGTPDVTLFFLSAFFLYLIVPIFAIVVTFDAVSKERVQGTLDLLLSRPVTRTGVLLGKFLGSFAAVAFPVTLVNVVGIGVITAASGEAPTGGFAAAFLAATLLLIAFYVLLQLIFSTLAKTGGTAVLFGVLVWLLFNILYNILIFVVGGVIGDPAARFQFQTYAGLGNPSSIYQQLIFLYAPQGLGFFGGTAIGGGLLAGAAVVWLVLLFALALWTFHKKAAD